MICPIWTPSLDLYTMIMIHDMSYMDSQSIFIYCDNDTCIMYMSYMDSQPRSKYVIFAFFYILSI